MRNRTRISRLKRLLAIMHDIPDHDFVMRTWGEKFTHCGTHACLLGHAALDNKFNAEGLVGKWCKAEKVRGFWNADLRGSWALVINGLSPFEDNIAEEGAKFFGITKKQAYRLFTTETHLNGIEAKTIKAKQLTRIINHYSTKGIK